MSGLLSGSRLEEWKKKKRERRKQQTKNVREKGNHTAVLVPGRPSVRSKKKGLG